MGPQVITQEPDEDQSALAVSSVLQVHKTDQYLPPLPGGLLNLLGLARQRRTSYLNSAALRRHKVRPYDAADARDFVAPVVRSNSDRAVVRTSRSGPNRLPEPSSVIRAQSAQQLARGVELTGSREQQSATPGDKV